MEKRGTGFPGFLALLLIGAHFWDKAELSTLGWVLVGILVVIEAF